MAKSNHQRVKRAFAVAVTAATNLRHAKADHVTVVSQGKRGQFSCRYELGAAVVMGTAWHNGDPRIFDVMVRSIRNTPHLRHQLFVPSVVT